MRTLLLLALLQAMILQTNAQNLLPMENLYDIKVMSCKVNNLPSKFIIDTGEKEARISITDVLYMLKIGYISPDDIKGTEYNQFVAGHLQSNTTIRISKLEIGNIKIANVTAKVDGDLKKPIVLGQSILDKLGKIEFDYNSQMVTVKSKDDYYLPPMAQLTNYKNTPVSNIDDNRNLNQNNSSSVKPQKVLIKTRTPLLTKPENGLDIISIDSNCLVNVLNNPSKDSRYLFVDYLGLKGYINRLAIEENSLTAVQKAP